MAMDSSNDYRQIYKIAFYAALLMLVIIPTQIMVFILFPIPTTTLEWIETFNKNPLVGFFHADFFILINNLLIAIIYLAFYHLLKETNKGLMQIGLIIGFIGIAAYISSNKTFELMALAKQYGVASTDSDKMVLLAAAKSLLLGWQGTAFDVYYVLNGITLLIISITMFRNRYFSKLTASFGFAAAILMCIPSTAGTIGLIFSLLSLIPWYVFTIMFARTFKKRGAF